MKAPLSGMSEEEGAMDGAVAGPLLALPPQPANNSNPDDAMSALMIIPAVKPEHECTKCIGMCTPQRRKRHGFVIRCETHIHNL
jgi:hypothetical protein